MEKWEILILYIVDAETRNPTSNFQRSERKFRGSERNFRRLQPEKEFQTLISKGLEKFHWKFPKASGDTKRLPKAHGDRFPKDKFPRLPKAPEVASADNCKGLSLKEHMLMDVGASYFLCLVSYTWVDGPTSWTCWVQRKEQRRPIDFFLGLLTADYCYLSFVCLLWCWSGHLITCRQ